MKKLLIGSASALLVASMVGCNTTVEKVDSSSNAPKKSTTTASAPAPQQKFKVGDAVKVNNLVVTITKAKFVNPSQFSDPKNGKVLEVDVHADNKGNDQTLFTYMDFALYDMNGKSMPDYTGNSDGVFSANLDAGKNSDGKLYFDVPDQKSFELVYKPTVSFDNKTAKFEVTVGK